MSSKRWIEAVLNWRDRLLSNPDFQRKSLRFPVSRWIARRRMRALFDLCSGFVYSQVLFACVRLDLFQTLGQQAQTAHQLADSLAVPPPAMRQLLDAAVALRLLEARSAQRYGLGPLGAALLGNPSVGMMIEHHHALYTDLIDPVALLRGASRRDDLAQYWGYSGNADPTSLADEQTRDYSQLMAASQVMISDQVLSAYSLRAHRQLLDVGGGAGAFASAAMQAHAELNATVFDLPAVGALAQQRFEDDGLTDRGRVIGGDFLNDPLPRGHDVISLIRVLHDHDDEPVKNLLRAIREAIPEDGVLLIAEPMLETRGAEPVGAAYFAFYLMAMGQGRPRSPATLTQFLREAGFRHVQPKRTTAPLLARVLIARP